jgi:hypothetical protein
MELFDKINEILEQEDKVLPKDTTKVKAEWTFDEKLFNKMANFIINLDPDKLTDSQLEGVINMIDNLEMEIQELQEKRLAQKTKLSKNQYSKKWYRANKTEIKRRKEKFKRSSEGRKRIKMKKRNDRIGRTATGRSKLEYNKRVRSDRK